MARSIRSVRRGHSAIPVGSSGNALETRGSLVVNVSGKRLRNVLRTLGSEPQGRVIGPLVLTFTCTPVFKPGADRVRTRQGMEVTIVVPVRSEIRHAPGDPRSSRSVYKITCAPVSGKILIHRVCVDGDTISLMA